jgi:nucleoside-diphosphate-sugar epimerase
MIAVTGAGGFIGTALCGALVQAGAPVGKCVDPVPHLPSRAWSAPRSPTSNR